MRTGYYHEPLTPKRFPDYGKGNCVYCGEPLPPQKRKYCRAVHGDLYRRDTAKYRTVTWGEVRTEVIKRDKHTCQDCGSKLELEVHHKLPIHRGGAEFDRDNLITLCVRCHKIRHRHRGREHEYVMSRKLTDFVL